MGKMCFFPSKCTLSIEAHVTLSDALKYSMYILKSVFLPEFFYGLALTSRGILQHKSYIRNMHRSA